MLPMAKDSFGDQEKAAIQRVVDSGFYTMGREVQKFEEAFAEWVGAKNAIMVNSGSSANLLLVTSLLYRSQDKTKLLKPGDEVIVPALSWPTTVWPIVQLGLVPVFADVDPETLALCPKSMQGCLSEKTKAVFLIHVLGHSAKMDEMLHFCEENELLLLEDSCESLGSHYQKKHVGRFGYGGTFSHFFSHHLSTIEGGTVITDDDELAEDLRSLRSHGWARGRKDFQEIEKKHKEIDPRFLFVVPGYNLKPTEIQAAVGQVQLERLDSFLSGRDTFVSSLDSNFSEIDWLEIIGGKNITNKENSRRARRHSWMYVPFLLKEKSPVDVEEAKKIFEKNGVETRPIIAGNLTRHPAIDGVHFKQPVSLYNSEHIMDRGFMMGCQTRVSSETEETLKKLALELKKI